MARVGVILSGCGFQDGAEIHESVLTLLALDRAGAPLGDATVVKVTKTKRMDQTAMVTLDVPSEWSMKARSFNQK